MRQKLNLITLGVDDFEKSLDFYEKGLGWKKSNKSMDGLALFPLGGIVLALHPRQELLLYYLVQKVQAVLHLASLSQTVVILSSPSLVLGTFKILRQRLCCD